MKLIKCVLSVFLAGLFFVASYAQTPATALDSYLNNSDPTYAWELLNSYQADKTQAYSILLISQKWQGILWKHELIVFIPEKISYNGALLFITGSSASNGMPKISAPDDGTSQQMAAIATKNQAVVAILKQVPNQPLYNNLNEDALISYTLNEFGKSGDYSWPLLFPMVKSARKAMDVIQEFVQQHSSTDIKRFVISGASKRGWTTWLTGASRDPRVVAIAPMVIDMLNMPVTLKYQQEMYGEFSDQINDYVKLDIPQNIDNEFGSMVVQMIDPYSYRDKLTMPKMIFMGTNDPYWTIDAVKHYINEIPGQNYLCYVPNAGHNLGDRKQAFGTLSAFFGLTMEEKPYPVCQWDVSEKGKKITLSAKASADQMVRAVLWTAESGSRDFRSSQWQSKEVVSKDNSNISTTLTYPQKGFSSFYIELIYKDPKGGEYSVTTRPYVANQKQVFIK